MKLTIMLISMVVFTGLLLITSCDTSTQSKNEPPVISSLTASPDTIEIEGTSILTCVANDPDGDSLTYTWESSLGSVSGSGSSVTWTAPNIEARYSASCKVDDGNGGQDVETVNIEVIPDTSEFIPGFFYYGNNQQIPIFKSRRIITVKFKSTVSADEAEELASQFGLTLFEELYEFYGWSKEWSNLINRDYVIMRLPSQDNIDDFITHYPKSENNDSFGNHPQVEFCMPSFAGDESGNLESRLFMGDEFIARSEADSSIVASYCTDYCVEIDRINLWGEYTLKITEQSPQNTLDMANHFYENDLFIWSLPNFLALITPNILN